MRKLPEEEKVSCDCIVYQFYNDNKLLHISNIKSTLTFNLEASKMMRTVFKVSRFKSPENVKGYVSKKSSFGLSFNYCPMCGTKINWKKIKEEL